MVDSAHQSVLLEEAVAALNIQPEGRYVDGTFGRGGHARRILQALDATGQLLVMDKDPTAIAEARRLQAEDARVHVAHDSFARLAEHVDALGWAGGLQGVLLDLGVSSPQLDEAERGFSFMRDGPLDMRMDNQSGFSAYEWLRDVDESELVRVLKEYGEERFARRVARKIVQAREADELPARTVALAELIASAIPGREPGKHPATRSFQAIRIAVNAELDDLAASLEQAPDLLAPGGRLVVIAFHSLEDRMVKRALRRRSSIGHLPPGVPVVPASMQPTLRLVGKAQKAAEGEVRGNVRSRSAVMRVAERLP